MRDNNVNVLKKMLGMILVAPVMLSLSLFAADPVHLWKLDETAGSTYVDSVGVADGNCSTGCPFPSDGQVYGAQNFDGINDKINITDTENFNWTPDANVTIEFWMKSNLIPVVDNDVMIGRAGEGGLSGDFDIWYVGVEKDTGYVRAAVGSSSGDINDVTVDSSGKNICIAMGNWNHIAFIITRDKMKVYVNGVLDINVTRTNPGSPHVDTKKVTFGTLGDNWLNTNWSYQGQLDEITLYNVELNASTIQQHYLNGLKPHLLEVTPVDVNTLEYTFSSDKNGTIDYGLGICESNITDAVDGNNTIKFYPLPDGTYSDCNITVTSTEVDTDGNVSDPLAVSKFVIDTTVPATPVTTSGGGGGCTYNPDSKNFDMMFLLMITLGLFYPFRRRFIK